MARRGVDATRIGAALELVAPTAPAYVHRDGLALVGTGPDSWLAVAEGVMPDWSTALTSRLAGLASVFDQTGGYVVFRIAGPGARTLLQQGAFIDLHPDAFGPGSAATTVIAHIGVTLWQVDTTPTFDVALFRSYASSFRHWIAVTAAPLPDGLQTGASRD
jgi:sarcosine oxidase subunit gamma